MKIRYFFLSLVLLATFCLPVFVASGHTAAVDIFKDCGAGNSNYNPDVCQATDVQKNNNSKDPIINIIKIAIDVLSFIIGIAAVITIVVSGIRMIVSGGDSNAVASARTGLIYALVGIAIVILAQTLVVFVLDKVS
jgi:hypothetical protein